MNVLDRGLQVYLLVLAVISAVVAVWGTNRFILDNPTTGSGWGVIVGIALVLIGGGLVVRYLYVPTDQGPLSEEYPWTR